MPEQSSNKALVGQLLILVTGMFAFGFFAMPPLYDVFFDITGFGGRTGRCG